MRVDFVDKVDFKKAPAIWNSWILATPDRTSHIQVCIIRNKFVARAHLDTGVYTNWQEESNLQAWALEEIKKAYWIQRKRGQYDSKASDEDNG